MSPRVVMTIATHTDRPAIMLAHAPSAAARYRRLYATRDAESCTVPRRSSMPGETRGCRDARAWN